MDLFWKWMIINDGNLLGDKLFNVTKEFEIIVFTERKSHPTSSCTSSSTNSMDIGFRNIWDIIVDHIFELVDIYPTRGNISSDENSSFLTFEIGECTFSIVLRFIPMDGFCTDSFFIQEFCYLISTVFGSGKNEDIFNSYILKYVNHEGIFIYFIHMIDVLIDRFSSR